MMLFSKAVTEGLATTLLDEILPELLDSVPGQPTAGQLQTSPAIAGRMFSRWCQENYFGYMMEHFDIDGLVAYESEDIPGTTRVINPAWRTLDNQIARLNTRLRSHQAKLGAAPRPIPTTAKKSRNMPSSSKPSKPSRSASTGWLAQRMTAPSPCYWPTSRLPSSATRKPATASSISSSDLPGKPQEMPNLFPPGSGSLNFHD